MYTKCLIQCLVDPRAPSRGRLIHSFIANASFTHLFIYLFIKHLLKASSLPAAFLVARNEKGKGLVPKELPFSLGEIDNKERNKKFSELSVLGKWEANYPGDGIQKNGREIRLIFQWLLRVGREFLSEDLTYEWRPEQCEVRHAKMVFLVLKNPI